jgi:hypothetical protein
VLLIVTVRVFDADSVDMSDVDSEADFCAELDDDCVREIDTDSVVDGVMVFDKEMEEDSEISRVDESDGLELSDFEAVRVSVGVPLTLIVTERDGEKDPVRLRDALRG